MSRNCTKRNLSASSPTQAGDNKSKIFITPNRYAALSDVSDEHHEVFSPPPVETPSQHQRNSPPNNTEPTPGPRFFKSFSSPPFMVSDGYSHPTLVKALLDLIDSSCIYFKSSSKYLIIYTDGAPNFNLVADYLLGNHIRFHTYQPKLSKPFSVYIRYLHPSTSIDDITTGLTEKGHEVIRVANILHRVTKCPLPLFRVDLKVADNNRDILKLDLFLHSRVKIELPKKKLAPPQCKDCQNYGHTSNYCQQTSRCVKCGENHPSSDCKKSPSEPAKCALCAGPHTASYKGCPIYKALVENIKKKKKRKLKTDELRYQFTPNVTESPPKKVFSRSSSKPERTYANTADNISSTEPISVTLSRFISSLNSLITPLITLLHTVVNSLATKSIISP